MTEQQKNIFKKVTLWVVIPGASVLALWEGYKWYQKKYGAKAPPVVTPTKYVQPNVGSGGSPVLSGPN